MTSKVATPTQNGYDVPIPPELMSWISSLPEADRTRETITAERNLHRLSEFLSESRRRSAADHAKVS
jgi:hypothetical protein